MQRNTDDIQHILFSRIKDKLPSHISLVDEIAELLGISNDSAYRRIRGEKSISLHEAEILMRKFNISLEQFSNHQAGGIYFHTSLLDNTDFPFKSWLEELLGFTTSASGDPETEVMFILNELNIFHLIQFPSLCTFKLFFWQKSNLGFDEFRDIKFSLDSFDDGILKLYKELSQNYVKISTTEFTTAECLNSFLKQVQYYSDSGYFASGGEAATLCRDLHHLIDHLKKQAELGYKFVYGTKETGIRDSFRLYHNDLVLADNTILIRKGDKGTTFLTSNAINLMQTRDPDFFSYNYRWGKNLLSKSVLISGTAERERNSFFRGLHRQVESLESKI